MELGVQHKYYTEHFSDAEFLIIQRNEHPIGRLYLHRRRDEIRIIDIALLSEYRVAGTGTCLIGYILADAKTQRFPVRLYVEKFNRALRLYQRLGLIPHDFLSSLKRFCPSTAQVLTVRASSITPRFHRMSAPSRESKSVPMGPRL
jgi:hypothetical protein